MNHKTLCLFATLALTMPLFGCDNAQAPDQPDAGPAPVPAQTTIEPTQFRNYGRFEAGEICMGTNMSSEVNGAPITLRDRDMIISVISVAYSCFVLQPGQYQVEFGEVKTFLGTPPKTGILTIRNGLRYDLFGRYNKTAEADTVAVTYPTIYKNIEKAFPAGELCVDSDLGGAPFEIRDREQIKVISSVTYRCFNLPPGGYTVRFLKVVEREQIPPSTVVQLKDEESHTVKGLYVR